MNAEALISDFSRRGIRLIPNPPKLIVAPASKLTDQDRQAIRSHKPALLEALTNRTSPKTEPAEPLCAFPIDLEAVADAIAAEPRSPFLNDLALSHAARTAVRARRIIRTFPEAARREALSLCASVSQKAADAIRARNYERAYQVLDTLSDNLKAFTPQ